MWYVIQVYSGQEKCIKELIEQYGDCKNIEDCKIPSYVKLKKQKEAWYPETKVLFPGYLFIKTQNIEELYQQLKSIPKMTKLLGVGKEITPISAEEERFLLTVGGDEMIIDLSKGVIEHGKVKVLSGPLQGMEGCIKRIDRHRRMAWVNICMFGRELVIPLALEVIYAC